MSVSHRFTNRLAQETSPYLLQHAHNPVDWYPWGEEAFSRARDEGKPVLLSVGYSACHWCHVMERESFENEQTAALMNARFVSIKVDREERPDVDQIYMGAVQALTGRGGWPMTVFLTPDGEPFYGGTYYPPEDRQGMPGFPRVLQAVADAYQNRRNELAGQASRLLEYVRENAGVPAAAGEPSPALLDAAAQQLKQQYDAEFGGFGGAPKFPAAMSLEFLLRYWRRRGDAQALAMVEHTLRQMAGGGIYDQLGGGFHRYSVDRYWLVPHFEKMLYDNALLARIYLLAYQATGRPEYRRICEATLDWVLREMTDPRGGFYSTLDADSEGEEGKFYVWTPAEVRAALGAEAAHHFMSMYDVTPGGNFEGKSILHRSRDLAEAARGYGPSAAELAAELAESRAKLLAARAARVRPGMDDKVLAAWNGLLLRALAEAARVLERDDYRAAAERNAEFVLVEMRRGTRLLRSWKDGRARLGAYLEDYAAYADGLIALYQATFEPRWLSEARGLADQILDRFWDDEQGAFFDTATDHERLIVRPRDAFDNATPAGNSLAADALLRLALFTGEPRYAERARRAIAPLAEIASRHPNGFGRLLCALDFDLSLTKEVVIVGHAGDPAVRALLAATFGAYRPHIVVAGAAPNDPEAVAATPLLEGRGLLDGRAAAYVCEGFVCNAPTADVGELQAQLDVA
ncbi:MAG TPA: thioredoxin domain-containing protein [Dehalococcoidia bacterium]|nr:thioredoxin domain-containing protein [Dehalococcoidia bacterium]